MAGEKDLAGGESASGRVDILFKRVVGRLVSKTGNVALMGAYAQMEPLTDALIDHYLGEMTLEDLAVDGAEKVANRVRRAKRRVAGGIRAKGKVKRKSGGTRRTKRTRRPSA